MWSLKAGVSGDRLAVDCRPLKAMDASHITKEQEAHNGTREASLGSEAVTILQREMPRGTRVHASLQASSGYSLLVVAVSCWATVQI